MDALAYGDDDEVCAVHPVVLDEMDDDDGDLVYVAFLDVDLDVISMVLRMTMSQVLFQKNAVHLAYDCVVYPVCVDDDVAYLVVCLVYLDELDDLDNGVWLVCLGDLVYLDDLMCLDGWAYL